MALDSHEDKAPVVLPFVAPPCERCKDPRITEINYEIKQLDATIEALTAWRSELEQQRVLLIKTCRLHRKPPPRD